jgi:drug/metabolite transporter (DMT)-like permease
VTLANERQVLRFTHSDDLLAQPWDYVIISSILPGKVSSVNKTQISQLPIIENTPLIMICLLIFDSLHFVFARLMLPYLPPTTSTLYFMGMATVEVALFMKARNGIHLEVLRDHVWFFLGLGFLVAASTILTFLAVAYVDPGTASLLAKSSIVFSVGLGVVWLRERFTITQTVGAVVAIGGVIIIFFQPGDFFQLGSLIVIVASFMYALHTALFKRFGQGLNLADFFLFRLASTTAFSLLIAVVRDELLLPPGWEAWVILFLTATINVVLSRGLYYLALQRLNLSLHAIILTLSPVVAVGWTVVLFGVWPTSQQLIGGAAVIAGVMMTVGQVRFIKVERAQRV